MEEQKFKKLEPKSIFKKSEDFKTYYVTGAIGGFRNPYDFRLTFSNVDSNSLVIKNEELRQSQNLTDDEMLSKLSELELPVILKCELIMTERVVKELHNFLGKELKRLENLKKEQ